MTHRPVGVPWATRDADRAHVVAEDLAEVVGVDLADVRGPSTETGQTTHRVRRRTTTHLDRRTERTVELGRALDLDERHRTLHETVLDQEVLGRGRDHVDEGVADSGDIETRRRPPVHDVGHDSANAVGAHRG
jgi:hypothetical protein